MNILVLYDPRKSTLQMMEELARQKIYDYLPFPGTISGFPTVEGCINDSHKRMIRMAKEERWPEVRVLESDVWFPALDGWQYFLSKKPAHFDIYLAATYCPGELRGYFPPVPTARLAGIYVERPAGFHCYIMHESYYDQFLATPDNVHIDTAQVGGFYPVCFPFAALQRPGQSANHRSFQNYNHELEHRLRSYVHWDA